MANDYLQQAVSGAQQFRRERQGGAVRVTEWPIGEATYARCHADVFRDNILTITAHDDNATIKEYDPLLWHSATVYDANGFILHTLTNPGRGR